MGKFVPPDSKVAVMAGMLWPWITARKRMVFRMRFLNIVRTERLSASLKDTKTRMRASRKHSTFLVANLTAGIYVNTVNCLPVCRALGARQLAGKVKLITTDLFAEMAPYFEKGTISASIYQQPYRQGQIAVRLVADNLISRVPLPPTVHLSPGVVMSSNLQLFREIRHAETKFSMGEIFGRAASPNASRPGLEDRPEPEGELVFRSWLVAVGTCHNAFSMTAAGVSSEWISSRDICGGRLRTPFP